MSNAISPNDEARGLAVVCVAFDDETPSLVASAIALARRTGIDLRFVSVVETNIPDDFMAGGYGFSPSASLVTDTTASALLDRQREMRVLTSSLPADLRLTANVLEGIAFDAIVADAKIHRANLILTACNLESYGRMMPRGVSVALHLMADAPLPVMVTSRAAPVTLDAQRPAILLADDLGPGSEEAAVKAYELATVLGVCRLRHMHVYGDFRDLVRASWRELKARHPALQAAGDDPEAALRAEYEGRVAALATRGGPARATAIARGTVVEPDVAAGAIVDRLADAIEDLVPALIVFGRHRMLKVRPFLVGSMGLHAMLKARRPVLVVPPRAELYAVLPFPRRLD